MLDRFEIEAGKRWVPGRREGVLAARGQRLPELVPVGRGEAVTLDAVHSSMEPVLAIANHDHVAPGDRRVNARAD